jgi:hypothetical protein
MAFSWLGVFGIHEYMHLRQFLLEELRSVGSHAMQLDAEIARIGTVYVGWVQNDDGNATEQREDFMVTPGTTLHKLFQAYIAQGGNPFDISMYLDPDMGVDFDASDEDKIVYKQPYGGLITVKTRENVSEPFDAGGELIYAKNPRLRIGKTIANDRAAPIEYQVANARGWANRAIRQKRSNLEWQIIKMLDLREQLIQERRDVLGQAVSELVEEYAVKQSEFARPYLLKENIATLDAIVFGREEDDENEERPPVYGTINVQNLQKGNYDFLTPPRQKGEDDWLGMKIPDNLVLTGDDRVDVVEDLAAPTNPDDVDTPA